MSESIKAKADRLFGDVFGTSDFGPLLKAIAKGEWTPEDARAFKSYHEGQEAERERCAKIAGSLREDDIEEYPNGSHENAPGLIIAMRIRKDRGCDPPQAETKSTEEM